MKIDENEFFRQATLRMSSSLNIETAMQRCMDYLKHFMPISGMLFGLYDSDRNIGKLLAFIWPENLPKPESTVSIPREFWTTLKAQPDQRETIRIINDILQEPDHTREVMSMIWPPEMSHITMDLELDEEQLGTFGIFAQGTHQYNETHAHLISLIHAPLAVTISNILKHQEIQRLQEMLADDNRYLQQQMMEMTGDIIIGANFGLKDVMQMVRQVAPLDSPVLLMGETGVGKEVIANAIHHSSQRRGGPCIKVNCGAIAENLIDSELFGHEKGAFTGAVSTKRGRFERAHNGTIFLDEIGELPLQAQVRLLRVLQHHEIERVGGSEPIEVNVRIVSATHRNLEEMIRAGQFREDLWFRLNVFPITIPPLRHRSVDIPALANHFIERKSREMKLRQVPPLAPGALARLQDYEWPGNVRELENIVERALILSQMEIGKGVLTFDTLAGDVTGHPEAMVRSTSTAIQPLEILITRHIENALKVTNGKVEGHNGAAQLLGLHPSTLRGRMRKLGIVFGKGRQP